MITQHEIAGDLNTVVEQLRLLEPKYNFLFTAEVRRDSGLVGSDEAKGIVLVSGPEMNLLKMNAYVGAKIVESSIIDAHEDNGYEGINYN